MPGLEHLRTCFHTLTPEGKVDFIRRYRTRRAADMEKPATHGARSASTRTAKAKFQNMGLTPEEMEIAKALGLKPADVLRLKEAQSAD